MFQQKYEVIAFPDNEFTADVVDLLFSPNIWVDLDLAYLFTEDPVIGGPKYSTSEGGVIELSNDSAMALILMSLIYNEYYQLIKKNNLR